MNNTLKVSLIAGVVALLVVSVVTYFRPITKEIVREVIKEVANSPTFGAIPGNEINADRVIVNGANIVPFNRPFNTGSTTLCSFDITATSTLVSADIKITTASTAALYLEIGKSRNPDATTTPFGASALAANIRGHLVASSSARDNVLDLLNGPLEFGPEDFLVFKYGGATCTDGASCTSLRGECNALFIE